MMAATRDTEPRARSGLALGVAATAALLASSCCVAPLVLALVGISGAWIGQMRRVEPYSPALMALAIVALAIAAWRLYRRPSRAIEACAIDDAACGRVNRVARRWFWVVAVLTLTPIVTPWVAPWFY